MHAAAWTKCYLKLIAFVKLHSSLDRSPERLRRANLSLLQVHSVILLDLFPVQCPTGLGEFVVWTHRSPEPQCEVGGLLEPETTQAESVASYGTVRAHCG